MWDALLVCLTSRSTPSSSPEARAHSVAFLRFLANRPPSPVKDVKASNRARSLRTTLCTHPIDPGSRHERLLIARSIEYSQRLFSRKLSIDITTQKEEKKAVEGIHLKVPAIHTPVGIALCDLVDVLGNERLTTNDSEQN